MTVSESRERDSGAACTSIVACRCIEAMATGTPSRNCVARIGGASATEFAGAGEAVFGYPVTRDERGAAEADSGTVWTPVWTPAPGVQRKPLILLEEGSVPDGI